MKKITIVCDLCEKGSNDGEFWSLCGNTVHVCTICCGQHPLVAKLVMSVRANDFNGYSLQAASQAMTSGLAQQGAGKIKA